MEREGGWWPAGPRRREPTGRTVVAEVLLVVAVALSLVVGVLAAVVLVLAVSTVVQALVGPEVAGRLEVQLVSWGLLVGLALWLPFALVAAVAALVGYVEARLGDHRYRRAARSPAAAGRREAPTADPSGEPTDADERDESHRRARREPATRETSAGDERGEGRRRGRRKTPTSGASDGDERSE